MSQVVVSIDGEPDVTIVIRDKSDRFKSWERRGLYESVDASEGKGVAVRELELMRRMSAHIIRSWSLEASPPRVELKDSGEIIYTDLGVYDQLDADIEAAIMLHAGPMVKQLQLNFGASPDKKSPTKPSGG